MGARTATAKGRLMRACRPPVDPVEVEDRRRDLAEAKIADYIAEVLAAAPELTAEARSRLCELLAPARVVIAETRLAELNGDGDAT